MDTSTFQASAGSVRVDFEESRRNFGGLEKQTFQQLKESLRCVNSECKALGKYNSKGIAGNPNTQGIRLLQVKCSACGTSTRFTNALTKSGLDDAAKMLQESLACIPRIDSQVDKRKIHDAFLINKQEASQEEEEETRARAKKTREILVRPVHPAQSDRPRDWADYETDSDAELIPRRKQQAQKQSQGEEMIPVSKKDLENFNQMSEEYLELQDEIQDLKEAIRRLERAHQEAMVKGKQAEHYMQMYENEKRERIRLTQLLQQQEPTLEDDMFEPMEKPWGGRLGENLIDPFEKAKPFKINKHPNTNYAKEVFKIDKHPSKRYEEAKFKIDKQPSKNYTEAAKKAKTTPPKPGNEQRSKWRKLAQTPASKLTESKRAAILAMGQEPGKPQSFMRIHLKIASVPNERPMDTRRRVGKFLEVSGLKQHIRSFSTIGKSIIEIYYCSAAEESVKHLIEEHRLITMKINPADFSNVGADVLTARRRQTAFRIGKLLANESLRNARGSILLGFDEEIQAEAHKIEQELRNAKNLQWTKRFGRDQNQEAPTQPSQFQEQPMDLEVEDFNATPSHQ